MSLCLWLLLRFCFATGRNLIFLAIVLLYHISLRCGIIEDGKVAEWLKALVLKTRDGNIRRFESCPFRQEIKIDPRGLILISR